MSETPECLNLIGGRLCFRNILNLREFTVSWIPTNKNHHRFLNSKNAKNWKSLFLCTSCWGDLWSTAKHPHIYIHIKNTETTSGVSPKNE